MWNGKTISVVFGTYREKNSIRTVIEDFFATGLVDEVIVVNNNAEPGTDEEVKKTKARLLHEPRQGYGYAAQRGMREARGEYVVLCEADATYTANDLEKFLIYAREFSVVLGTRTNQSTILSGAAMGFLRKWANIVEAKMIEVLFNTNSLTDVGCNYKLIRREALGQIAHLWRTGSALFTTELILLVVSERIPFVEIPITFRPRIGTSTLTAFWYQLVRWGLVILVFILAFWLRWMAKRTTRLSL